MLLENKAEENILGHSFLSSIEQSIMSILPRMVGNCPGSDFCIILGGPLDKAACRVGSQRKITLQFQD